MEIKKHFGEVHNRKSGYLEHLKLDRNDCNEMTEKGYHSDNVYLWKCPQRRHAFVLRANQSRNLLQKLNKSKTKLSSPILQPRSFLFVHLNKRPITSKLHTTLIS